MKNLNKFCSSHHDQYCDDRTEPLNVVGQKSDTFIDKRSTVLPVVTVLFCTILNAVLFYRLFDCILAEAHIIKWMNIFAFLVAFDVAPVYLGLSLRRYSEGHSTQKSTTFLFFIIFMIGAACNMALRIIFRNDLTISYSGELVSVFNNTGAVSLETSLIYAILSGMVSVLLSAIGAGAFMLIKTHSPEREMF